MSVQLPALAMPALDGVTSLVEKSLLRYDETSCDKSWYVMLETVREFALEQLEAAGMDDALRRRHALRYLDLTEHADQELHGPEQIRLLGVLEREHDNCREALAWCAAKGYAEPALRMASALWWFWYVRGYAGEGREWLMGLLQRFKGRPEVRLRALEAAGHLASFQGDLAAARALHEDGLLLAEEMEDITRLYTALQNLGFVTRQQGDLPAARAYFERCLSVGRAGGVPDQAGNALHNLGNLEHDLGNHELACAFLKEAVKLFAESRLPRSEAIAHLSLGMVAADQGEFERARGETSRARALMSDAGDGRQTAHMTANLASIAMALGELEEAQQHLTESLRLMHEIGDAIATARVLERFAVWWLTARDEPRRALRLAGAAARLRQLNGTALEPRAQLKLDAELAGARAALGQGAAAAMAAGRELSIDEAVAEALGEAPAPECLHEGTALAGLTAREQQIAALIAGGATNKGIADSLVIAEGTAANHVLHILNKLGFSSRTQVAVWAAQQGLLTAAKRS